MKGIAGIDADTAAAMLRQTGIKCNWWREVGTIYPHDVRARLTDDELDDHLHDYEHAGKLSPFISSTAGTGAYWPEPDDEPLHALYPALWTAIGFATRWGKASGFVFYGYVMVLPTPSIPLREFAEAVRDIHIYPRRSRYRQEGELVAKLEIPSIRLERCEPYRPQAWRDMIAGRAPRMSGDPIDNPSYLSPERYSNVVDAM